MYRLVHLLCLLGLSSQYVAASDADYKRTMIFIEKPTTFGQNVFCRGGLDHSRRPGCNTATTLLTNQCAIPIKHNVILNTLLEAVNAWSINDNFLDWYGPEPEQGLWNGISAGGSPAVWTTNDPANPLFNVENKYGPHYWMLDIDMDCSKTENGFFELKGFMDGFWENDINQAEKCSGTEGVVKPFDSKNHICKCGAKNVFHYNSGDCEISKLI